MIRTRTYVLVYVFLIALTGLTLGLSFLPLGALEAPVAIGIACVKAGLVLGFFMHLVEHRRPYGLFLLVGVVLLASLVVLMALDVKTRAPRTRPRSSAGEGSAAHSGP